MHQVAVLEISRGSTPFCHSILTSVLTSVMYCQCDFHFISYIIISPSLRYTYRYRVTHGGFQISKVAFLPATKGLTRFTV